MSLGSLNRENNSLRLLRVMIDISSADIYIVLFVVLILFFLCWKENKRVSRLVYCPHR
jgi:hypothetical protein